MNPQNEFFVVLNRNTKQQSDPIDQTSRFKCTNIWCCIKKNDTTTFFLWKKNWMQNARQTMNNIIVGCGKVTQSLCGRSSNPHYVRVKCNISGAAQMIDWPWTNKKKRNGQLLKRWSAFCKRRSPNASRCDPFFLCWLLFY